MKRNGYVLLAALWLTVALSAVVLDASLWLRLHTQSDTTIVDAIQTSAAADAGLQWAIEELRQEVVHTQPLVETDPRARFLVWHELAPLRGESDFPLSYEVEFQDAASALNLNMATHEQLLRLLAALELPPERASDIATRIESARGVHDPMRMGLDSADAALIAPNVSTLGSGKININTAPAPVLASLPGFTLETARAIVDTRTRLGPLSSVLAVVDNISPASRDSLFEAAPSVSGILVAETTELIARSAGMNAAGRRCQVVVALLVRRGDKVLMASRWAE